MMIIKQKEIIKILKSRLNTQRRIFNFDNHQILVLPILEHEIDIKTGINKIKFYTDLNGGFITIKDIKEIKKNKDGSILICDNNKKTFSLFSKKMDGSFEKIIKTDFLFKNLTIDHSPSIQIVLFTMFLNKTKEFGFLTDFSESIKNKKFDLKEIKSAGFKDLVIEKLNSATNRKEIKGAYKSLFDKIELEIILDYNNNANLSSASLEYYKNNIKTNI